MKYLGAIIGVVLLLLLGVSFPLSLLIVGITWLVVYVVAKANAADDQSRNEYKAPDKKEITNSAEFPQPPAWAKKEEPLEQSVTPTSRIHGEPYSENNNDNNKVSAYAYHNGAGTYNGSATLKSEVIAFVQRSEVSDIAGKQDIANIVQSIYDYSKIGEEHNVIPATISDDVKTAVGNVIYMLIEHAACNETLIEVTPKPDERSLTIERLGLLIDNVIDRNSDNAEDDVAQESKDIIFDDSIIDVTGQPVSIKETSNYKETNNHSQEVPAWPCSYSYGHDGLYSPNCTNENKRFYKKYKKAFINGIYYDLNGNTNYSFCLMQDLCAESNQDPNTLITYLKAFVEHYPETERYAKTNYINRIKELCQKNNADWAYINELVQLYPDYNWQFTDKYAKDFALTRQEIDILRFIENKWDSFYSSLDVLNTKSVLFFREAIKVLEGEFIKQNETLENIIAETAKGFDIKDSRGRYDYSRSIYIYGNVPIETKIKEIYNCIFRLCRNELYKRYGFSWELDLYAYLENTRGQRVISTGLMPKIEITIRSMAKALPDFTDEEEVQVNKSYTTRWRPIYKEITENFDGNISEYIKQVNRLSNLNRENHGQTYLLFDTSKFLIGKDDIAALKMYLRYVDAYRKFSSDTEKPLPKYICKKLFKKQEHQDEFEQIVHQYKCDKDQVKAYEAIDQLFLPKRKKLQLDQNEISKIAEQHSETVLLLNEVMEEGEVAIVDTKPKQDITAPNPNTTTSDLQTNALLDSLHLELLDIFVENDHSLAKARVEDFAKSKGLMANRLIDKINELCYETLDDVLIEDENDKWTIMEEYLKKIVA